MTGAFAVAITAAAENRQSALRLRVRAKFENVPTRQACAIIHKDLELSSGGYEFQPSGTVAP